MGWRENVPGAETGGRGYLCPTPGAEQNVRGHFSPSRGAERPSLGYFAPTSGYFRPVSGYFALTLGHFTPTPGYFGNIPGHFPNNPEYFWHFSYKSCPVQTYFALIINDLCILLKNRLAKSSFLMLAVGDKPSAEPKMARGANKPKPNRLFGRCRNGVKLWQIMFRPRMAG